MRNTYRKYYILGLFAFLLCVVIGLLPSKLTKAATEPTLNAEGAILIDGDTGQVLYSKNGDKQFFPASTTKIMTAIVVLDKAKLTDKVTISKNTPFADGTSIGLREGEIYTVEDLLQGLLLMSGNDCATALADHVSGSEAAFAKLMTEKAKEIGATSTVFKNASGLPDKEHLATPNDLALIMKEALKYDDIVRISKILSTKLPPSTKDGNQIWLANHNYLVNKNSKYFYPYALSGKNGYTIEASHTFAISARKDGHTLVASFLKATDRNQLYLDMATLFEYGFNNFTTTKLYSKGDEVGKITLEEDVTIPLLASKDILYTYSKDKGNIKKDLDFTPPDLLKKTVTKGEVVANAKVTVNGESVATLDLVSGGERVFTPSLAFNSFCTNNKFLIGFSVILVISLILFLIRVYNLRKRRKAINDKYARILNRKKDAS